MIWPTTSKGASTGLAPIYISTVNVAVKVQKIIFFLGVV
jgi:hypothetical protein